MRSSSEHPPPISEATSPKGSRGKLITSEKRAPGRPKGSPNKVQKAAKDAIAEAAEKLGGVNRLVTWAQEDPLNERAFWATIYPKLLPLTLAGGVDIKINWPVRPPAIER